VGRERVVRPVAEELEEYPSHPLLDEH